jgi:hypothetical protein
MQGRIPSSRGNGAHWLLLGVCSVLCGHTRDSCTHGPTYGNRPSDLVVRRYIKWMQEHGMGGGKGDLQKVLEACTRELLKHVPAHLDSIRKPAVVFPLSCGAMGRSMHTDC